MTQIQDDPRAAFIRAAVWHGALDQAQALLAEHPSIATGDIHAAALLGDDLTIRRFIAQDSGAATAPGPPLGWDPLTHLCFSKYLRLDRERTAGFLAAATALLDAGANPNTGFFSGDHQPNPEFESALYGAAGVAHHAELTRLLLSRGADPNDAEVPYHAPETHDNSALEALVESGKLTPDSLATMLLRKADWHDLDGIRYLLKHGADPNRRTHWRLAAIHQAIRRDNDLANIEAMLDHGADPTLPNEQDGRTGVAMAARRGRGDILAHLESRGIPILLQGVDRLIAACARNDPEAIREQVNRDPGLVPELLAQGGTLLAEFAGTANREGVRQLLDLGVPVGARYHGDPYFGIAANSTALHVAAWRAWPRVVRLLLERGATVDAPDGQGQTALVLAVKACVDSYWRYRRTPETVDLLLNAGASRRDVSLPTGYDEIDRLLERA